MAERTNEPIAIVGSACRFAGGANAPSKLWDLLREPVDLQSKIPADRFSADGFYAPDASFHGHSNVRHAYFLDEDPAALDAEFFGIKPIEAKAIDPQQRLLMEVAYETLESAGMPLHALRGSDTGVYAGIMFHDYANMLARDLQEIPTYYATGTGQSVVSNRISYFFDWRGPSVTVDTACSSSLVAVHLAAQSLRAGESRMALACGTNLILGPEPFIIESKLHMLSPDGRGRMWDQAANGYARGEGVAALALKTLSAALADGDHIHCLIRETGINQDGATPGITMPSAAAQQALIRRTYAKASLDLLKPTDRPQFFEAHGTGTPAGDPTEAEAVYRAFYTTPSGDPVADPLALGAGHPLYVGSIKTVTGHTEGTAGVASLIKVALALQHGVLPPNLLLEQLSDRVAPFYHNLEILRTAKPWPSTSGQPRRASVNSFGFGGANAHAILESYDVNAVQQRSSQIFTPFVFSAFSQASLRETLRAYASFLDTASVDISPQDLAWTLRSRRSLFSNRIAFPSSSISDLRDKINAKLSEAQETNATLGITAASSSPKKGILGVFTGQGAQYARMGAELIEQSPLARTIIRQLDMYLSEIPDENDRPAWSLEQQLLAAADSSKVYEAEFSQPLCTAVQILLVQLLAVAGIQYSAVIGHSSGEIAAAYAAGCLSARHSMYIAYYRGLYASLAASPNGREIKGAMMAVGASMEDMMELVGDSMFAGRVTVAASNSSSSSTLSGDEDAISELELVLDDEDIFHRRLKVDTAYHSGHMLPCATPYRKAIKKAGVKALKPSTDCVWYSSLRDGEIVDADMAQTLENTYWPDNMTQPVLFKEALTSALVNSYDMVLEVGPHPALAAPAIQTIKEVLGKEIPYHGVLSRGSDAVQASSTALGYLWSHLDNTTIDLDKYERALMHDGADAQFHLVLDLPTYQWNRQARYWHEGRSSRKMRHRSQKVHPLLGDVTSDSAPHHMSWRNLLRVNEIDWLSGHAVQSQVVFPAAGYLSTALEASRWISGAKPIRLIEILNFNIHQAVVFEQSDPGVEVLIEMAEITSSRQGAKESIRAHFTYSAALNAQSDDLELVASGSVIVHVGEPSRSLLPSRGAMVPHMIDVESERFYSALDDLGYCFQDRFRALTGLQRKRGRSSCLLKMQPSDDAQNSPLLIHPAELDATLQSSILAYSYPYDEELRTLHLPTDIRQIRVNPAALLDGISSRGSQDELVPVDAFIDPGVGAGGGKKVDQKSDGIVSNVSLYASSGTANPHAAIQIQGARFKPLGAAVTEDDRRMYSNVHWVPNQLGGIEDAASLWETELDQGTAALLERIATYYLRKFDREIPADHPARSSFTTKWYLNYAKHMMDILANSPPEKERWEHETLQTLMDASEPYMHLPDVQIMHLVGTQMPRVFEGETTMLEEFRADGSDILDRYYSEGLGLKESAMWLGRAVKQLTDRNPHLNILEVGAGTGGATKAIFDEIGGDFLSYTYTDISTGFFENASENFSQHKKKMIFKALDLEKDPISQGFVEGTYDLVVAFFVVHATDLEPSLRCLRRLLKPGGQLILGEGCETGNGVTPTGFIFGTLPGWWVGTGRGRDLCPLVSPIEWDRLLRVTGFSGADTAPCITLGDVFRVFPVVTQATDDYINFLREPVSTTALIKANVPPIQRLFVIGGRTQRSSRLVTGLAAVLQDFAGEIHCIEDLQDHDLDLVDSMIICLSDLDSPVFKDISLERFTAYKEIFKSGNKILWVTSGRLCDEPWANMSEAFARVVTHEMPDLSVQQLDLADPEHTSPETIVTELLRMHSTSVKKTSDVSWTFEPEVAIDHNGKRLVPRTRFLEDLNDRYNAGRRPVIREVAPQVHPTPVTLEMQEDDTYELIDTSPYEVELSTNTPQKLLELHISHSVRSAVKTPFGHKFLVLGVETETGNRYMTLASSLTSTIKVSADSAVNCEQEDVAEVATLTVIAAHLVALTVLERVYSGQTLVAHNASSIMAEALAVQAASMAVDVVFVVDESEHAPASWIQIPRFHGPDIDEILLLPDSTAAFVGLTDHQVEPSENEASLMFHLQPLCNTVMNAKSLFAPAASKVSNARISAELGSWLSKAVTLASKQLQSNTQTIPSPCSSSILLGDIVGCDDPLDPLCVIDWRENVPLPVHATRLDAGQMFKGAGSTYWIEGMSGALGISLVDWMVQKGARNLVVTSRNPDVAPEWIASHQHRGATVRVLACDVTKEEDLKATHRKICETMPPIVGVIHGAMVLRDVSCENMSFDQLTDVLKPKVNGSIYLDRIFHETDLDFFVLTSSLNTVIGSAGQANYAAANAFMCSLAGQRRKRGYRASVVNIGAIIGAGYMEREARRAWDRVAAQHYMMRLSEEDFVQSICEAIHASRLDSPHGWEISIGLDVVPFAATNRPSWSFEPKHAVFLQHQQAVIESENQEKKTASSASYLRELLECTSEQGAYDIVKKAFAVMLRAVLQVDSSDDTLMMSLGSEIGLDSLVSVDVRSWFLKNLQVGIPVLKIMSNTTMGALVELAVESLPVELAPQLHASSDSENDTASASDDQRATSPTISDTRGTETPLTADTPLDDTCSMLREPLMSASNRRFVAPAIDWEAECCPPASLENIPLASEMPAPATPPRIVVLTGATGLYGHNLLAHLLQKTTVEKVICIAIRNLSSRLATGELPPASPRVAYHEGDLAAPLLGLEAAEAVSIFNAADAVIHNGADTSHLKRYAEVRAANVGSTAALAQLCLPRRIPLHYVSSAGLAIFYGRDAFPPVSTRDSLVLPAADGSLGYASTKWVSEQLLERTHARYAGAWPLAIHRPSTIVREGPDAAGPKAQLDWMHAMLAYARASRSVPAVHACRGALDLVHVRTACADLLAPVLRPNAALRCGDIAYLHQVGDLVLPLDRLHELPQRSDPQARPFTILPMQQWVANARAAGVHPAVAALIEALDEHDAPDYPRLLKEIPSV